MKFNFLRPLYFDCFQWFWNHWTITIECFLRVQPLVFEFLGQWSIMVLLVRFATAMHDNKYQRRLAVVKFPLLQKSIIKIENGNCDTKKYLSFLENIVNFNDLRRSLSSSLVIWWPLKISMVCRRHWKYQNLQWFYRKDHRHLGVFDRFWRFNQTLNQA